MRPGLGELVLVGAHGLQLAVGVGAVVFSGVGRCRWGFRRRGGFAGRRCGVHPVGCRCSTRLFHRLGRTGRDVDEEVRRDLLPHQLLAQALPFERAPPVQAQVVRDGQVVDAQVERLVAVGVAELLSHALQAAAGLAPQQRQLAQQALEPAELKRQAVVLGAPAGGELRAVEEVVLRAVGAHRPQQYTPFDALAVPVDVGLGGGVSDNESLGRLLPCTAGSPRARGR